jgi:hypothetical protein
LFSNETTDNIPWRAPDDKWIAMDTNHMQNRQTDQTENDSRPTGSCLSEGLLLSLVVGFFLCYSVYELTLQKAVPELSLAKERVDRLEDEAAVLAGRLRQSRAARIVAEQESGVMRQANRLLREEESRQQAELSRLRADLDFYRRLTATGGAQSGLAIFTAEISTTDSPLVFHFEITLTHNIRRAAIVSGQVLIDVEGTLNDRPVTLFWSQLTDGNKPQPNFRFKYFQQIEGYIALPDEFSPTQLLLSLEPNGQRKPVSRVFDWQALVADSAHAASSAYGETNREITINN